MPDLKLLTTYYISKNISIETKSPLLNYNLLL
jgi:hypothetical protein